jgi:hypothetical protein
LFLRYKADIYTLLGIFAANRYGLIPTLFKSETLPASAAAPLPFRTDFNRMGHGRKVRGAANNGRKMQRKIRRT